MRVLVVTNLYPNPWQPHRAPFNRQQLRILGRRHPVQIIAPIAWTEERSLRRSKPEAMPSTRRVELDGLTVDHPRYYFPPRVARGWYGTCFQWSIRRTFQRALAEFQPDVIFSPWAYPDGWAAGRLARQAGLPCVVQVHGSDVKLLDQFPARQRGTVESLQAADGVVAVSEDLARIIREFGVNPAKLRVIYDGIDPDWFSPGDRSMARRSRPVPGDQPLLLFIGNLVPVKAVDVLLRALARVHRQGPKARLAIIGGGTERLRLEQLTRSLGLADFVHFQGIIPQVELPEWYRAADLFVLPSHSEGVPNVLLEASGCGTPWVASRVGGIPEIAHLGRSLLVPPNQPEALAAAILQQLARSQDVSEPLPRQKLRTEAVDELEAFLQTVLSERAAS